jgi:class 3 adenylate cyclase
VSTFPGLLQLGRIGAVSALHGSGLGVNKLQAATVTLLLADVEGPTRLWET